MTANDSMIVAVNWISRIFVHLDEFCYNELHKSLSPGHFMMPNFPLETTYKLRTWFIDLWNTRIVQELRERPEYQEGSWSKGNDVTHKMTIDKMEDPVRFIVRTWPWKEDATTLGLAQALIPVFNNSGVTNTHLGGKRIQFISSGCNEIEQDQDKGLDAEKYHYDSIDTGNSESKSIDALTNGNEEDPLVRKVGIM